MRYSCFRKSPSCNHDKIIQELLFELSTWHALAKLRLHTESTLVDLENSTIRLGHSMRNFEKNVCSHYETKELPSELAARTRRQSKKKANDRKAAATATRGS